MNDLILQCENEIINYKPPDIMIDSYGNNLMAYVSYVFTGDTDVPPAIVLAQTLINSGSRADRIVLITSDVSDESRNLLSMFYNKVVDVSYINISNIPLDKIEFKYIQNIFAKYYALTLVRYRKILLVHPHSVILKFPDYVFTLQPPLTITVDKETPIASSWYEKYCNNKNNNKSNKRNRNITDYYIFDGTINTNYLLLEPSMKHYNRIIESLIYNLNNGIINFPDTVILTSVYTNWHTINPRFMAYSGLPHWKMLYGTYIDINNVITTKDYLNNDAYILWLCTSTCQ